MSKAKKNLNNYAATLLGIMTSLATAYAVLDVDALDFHSAKTYFKLAIIGLPALGGYVSTIKSKEDKLKDGEVE